GLDPPQPAGRAAGLRGVAARVMAGTRAEIAAGAAVLAVAAAFAVYAAKGAGLTAGRGDSYPLTASFRAVDGISPGSDVRLAGLKVGTISSLKLNPDTFMAD